MLYEKYVITEPTGHHDFHNYYGNLYITNPDSAEGYLIINGEEKINVDDIDLIEDIPGGVKSIDWSISTPDKLPIAIIVSVVHLKPTELIFKTKETLPVNVTNPTITIAPDGTATFTVEQSTGSVWDINVTNATLDVSITNSTVDVTIADATITIDTAITELQIAWPGAQIDYNYSVFYSSTSLTLNNLPYMSSSGGLNNKQIINLPDTVLVDADTFTYGTYIVFKYELYRPTTDVLYSGNLDDLVPTTKVSAAAAVPPTDYYSTTIDLGTDIATLRNLYLIIYMSIYFTTSSAGGGDITAYFEGSYDGVTWVQLDSVEAYAGPSSSASNSTGNVGILVADKYRYYRFHYHVNVGTGLSSYSYTFGLRKVLGWL